MNRSWTHQNIARSAQFGEICPVYEGGFVHRKLDIEVTRPGFLSGGIDPDPPIYTGYDVAEGGSWRDMKNVAISWVVYSGAFEIFFKGVTYTVTSVPSNYQLRALSLSKDYLIALFAIGTRSDNVPVVMRKYQSFRKGWTTKNFSDILQAEMPIPELQTYLDSSSRYNLAQRHTFAQDGRAFFITGNSTSFTIYRFNSDFTSYSTTTIPSTNGISGTSPTARMIDGLGFSVMLVSNNTYTLKNIQPVYGVNANPYVDDPISWAVSDPGVSFTLVNPAYALTSLCYSSVDGIHVYSISDSLASSYKLILVLDGVTYMLSNITGSAPYYEYYMYSGLALPGTNLLYIRWGYPLSNVGNNVMELHVDLKTRAFTFHYGGVRDTARLALTTI